MPAKCREDTNADRLRQSVCDLRQFEMNNFQSDAPIYSRNLLGSMPGSMFCSVVMFAVVTTVKHVPSTHAGASFMRGAALF
jgi:hypothetical protein